MKPIKPIKPIEPLIEDFPRPIVSNGKNSIGEPLFIKVNWIKAKRQYNKDLIRYEEELQTYEQLKMIKLIKNATEKYCLKTFKIIKNRK